MTLISPHESLVGIPIGKYLSVKAAAEHFGYNQQYLRRLLRAGRLEGIKIGQVWLISLGSLEAHLRNGLEMRDQRFGPQGMAVEKKSGVV